MKRAIETFLLLSTAAACSQRSPWVAPPAPATVRSVERDAGGPTAAGRSSAGSAEARSVADLGSLRFPLGDRDGVTLENSFDDLRDGGSRRHQAIDIMAPRGTPVLSVQDGRILRLSNTSKGGLSVYATDPDDRFVYYYAHLDRYHAGLYAGRPVLRGDTIGYVGTTGNAPKTVPHLHFQMMRMPADRKYWNGEAVNPYSLLRASFDSLPGR